MTVRDILEKYNLKQVELCRRFDLPERSVRSWVCDVNSPSHRDCPDYLVNMMDECLSHSIEKPVK